LTNDSAPISAGGPNPLSDAQIGQIGALVLNGDALLNAPPSGYTANDVAAAIPGGDLAGRISDVLV
jgi:hypothetical protein